MKTKPIINLTQEKELRLEKLLNLYNRKRINHINLKQIRDKRNYSQEELGFTAGLDYRTYQRIENGEITHPRTIVICSLALILDVSINCLVLDED